MTAPAERPGTTGTRSGSSLSGRTITGVLADATERFAPAPWMAFGDKVQTFGVLRSRVEEIAAGLDALQVGAGQRVGLFLGNCFEWLQVEYGITALGAWLVPLNTMLHERELTHIVGQSTMETLLWGGAVLGRDTTPLLLSLVPELGDGPPGSWRSATFPDLRRVVGIGPGPWPPGVTSWESVLDAGRTGSAPPLERRMEAVGSDDIALVLYTSGTTGAPKGALLRHGAIVDHVDRWAAHLGLGPHDRSIMASPLFWSFGCTINALVPLLVGSMVVLEERFEAGQFLADLSGHRCTHLQGVPSQYELALAHPDSGGHDLTSIRLVQIGGSSSAESLAERLLERMPKAQMLSSYGLSEAVGVNTYTDLGDSLADVTRTVGHAAEDNEIELRDPDAGTVVEPGEVGEMYIRGSHVLAGYLADEAATKAALVDGWLRTGDLATCDERGYFTIAGRASDAYKRGGMNVYPAEVEGVLQDHPGVRQVAVVGVPDPVLGEVGVAFVVREPAGRPGPAAELSGDEVLAYCRQRVAAYKVPEVVQLVAELPLTPTGKVQKFRLRQQWTAG